MKELLLNKSPIDIHAIKIINENTYSFLNLLKRLNVMSKKYMLPRPKNVDTSGFFISREYIDAIDYNFQNIRRT